MTHTLTPSGNDSTGKEWGARVALCTMLRARDSGFPPVGCAIMPLPAKHYKLGYVIEPGLQIEYNNYPALLRVSLLVLCRPNGARSNAVSF